MIGASVGGTPAHGVPHTSATAVSRCQASTHAAIVVVGMFASGGPESSTRYALALGQIAFAFVNARSDPNPPAEAPDTTTFAGAGSSAPRWSNAFATFTRPLGCH